MSRALLKKQLLESFAWLFQNRKTGKNRRGTGLVLFALLYALVFIMLGVVFYMLADSMYLPLAESGLTWLYFALMGFIAVLLGVFGSIFNTYASLYRPRDNDLLLSMPIPVRHILTARLAGVFTLGLLYEAIVLIPALAVHFIQGRPGAVAVVFSLLIPSVLALFVLALSCILGWLVALVASRIKNTKFLTVLLSLAFFCIYYYFCGNFYSILESFLANPFEVGKTVKGALYPLYLMGLAAQGDTVSMILFTGMLTAAFAAVYFVLSRSFLKLATANRGFAKAKYVEKRAKHASASSALLRREFKRFTGSASYMLNCGFGLAIMLIAAVALAVKGSYLVALLAVLPEAAADYIPLICTAAVCLMASTCDISAPSISLEGKNIQLIQSFPVSSWQVLRAKLKLHLILTLVPAAVLIACIIAVFLPGTAESALIAAACALFIYFCAASGLALNLKLPNLNWTNETVPIKQSMSVGIALFGGWALVAAAGFGCYLLRNLLSPNGMLACICALLLFLNLLLRAWLKTRGARIFERL